jgi:hypothetical protein
LHLLTYIFHPSQAQFAAQANQQHIQGMSGGAKAAPAVLNNDLELVLQDDPNAEETTA